MDPDALARALRGRRPGDRLRPGGQRQHAARSTRWSRSRTCASSPARGCTSTARSACGPPPRRSTATSRAASSAPTPGPPTRHKWLNVPYDCGLAIVADRDAHRRAMGLRAAYLVAGEQRDNYDFTPEASRRARGFPVYAALRSLGRRGVAELVERYCAQARALRARCCARRREVLNDVVLNQVLVAAPAERRRAHPGRRHLLGRRHGLARPRGDADLGLPGRRPTPTSSARRARSSPRSQPDRHRATETVEIACGSMSFRPFPNTIARSSWRVSGGAPVGFPLGQVSWRTPVHGADTDREGPQHTASPRRGPETDTPGGGTASVPRKNGAALR